MNITLVISLSVLFFAAGFAGGFVYQRFYKGNKLQKQNELLRIELEELSGRIKDIEFTQSRFILNPHLFKNTLNSIQSYAFRTHQALEKLGGVLDYILYDSNTELISPREEIEFVRNFIDLNKIKLNPLFDIRVKISADESSPLYTQQILAPMITAYFIENAFKHADLQSAEAFISISLGLKDGYFDFRVSNRINRSPIFSGKGGIGQANMKKRLDLLYNESYELEYSEENNIYSSHLKINLLEFKSKMLDIG